MTDRNLHEIIQTMKSALEIALISLRAWNGERTWEMYRRSPEVRGIIEAIKLADGAK